MSTTLAIVLIIAAFVVGGLIFFFLGMGYRKATAEKEIKSAEEEARRIINEAIKSGESKKREMTLEAKEEILRSKNELDREIKERRGEVSKLERRCVAREPPRP